VAFGKPSELIDGVTAPVNVHKLFLWLGAFAGTLLVGLSKAIKFAHVTFFSEGLIKNADGSVDLYFGRKAPKGKESNWIQINKGESVFVYLRLYGPEQAYFDHTFPMNKIKKLK
jgi:hypothetical protein